MAWQRRQSSLLTVGQLWCIPRLSVQKRVSTRTNWLGVEQFSSYGQKVLSRLTDGALMAIGYSCLGAAPMILVCRVRIRDL